MNKFHLVVLSLMSSIVLAASGCQTGDSGSDPFANEQGRQREFIAQAAQATFPEGDGEASQVVAIVRGENMMLANTSSTPYNDVSIWVNGNYVRRIPTIPPNGQVPLSLSSFYDKQGTRLTDFTANVNTVQFASGDTLYNAQGPVEMR